MKRIFNVNDVEEFLSTLDNYPNGKFSLDKRVANISDIRTFLPANYSDGNLNYNLELGVDEFTFTVYNVESDEIVTQMTEWKDYSSEWIKFLIKKYPNFINIYKQNLSEKIRTILIDKQKKVKELSISQKKIEQKIIKYKKDIDKYENLLNYIDQKYEQDNAEINL